MHNLEPTQMLRSKEGITNSKQIRNDSCTYMSDLMKEYDVKDNYSKLSPTRVSKYERSTSWFNQFQPKMADDLMHYSAFCLSLNNRAAV